MRDLPELTEYDKDILLKWFFYTLDTGRRRALMAEHPTQYNRAMGREVVAVQLPLPSVVRMGVTIEEESLE